MSTGHLQGIGILVTRPTAQSGELISTIEAAGGRVFQLPVLQIDPRNANDVRRDLAELAPPDIVIYISRNAVLQGAGLVGSVTEKNARIAAIGPATLAALEDAGHNVEIRPTNGFDSEHLLEHEALNDVVGLNILIVRGDHGRELLAGELRTRGALVSYVAVYERMTASPDDEVLAQLQSAWHRGRIDVVIVMSVESLTSLMKILPVGSHSLLKKTLLVTPSKRVIQTALEILPDTQSFLANGVSAEKLVEAIVRSQRTSYGD